MSNNSAKLRIDNVTVRFAWLHAPDVKFDPNFSVTIPLTDEVKAKLSAAAKSVGGKKVNGVRSFTNNETGDEEKVVKFVNRILIEKENAKSFGCVDSNRNPCDAAMGGDVVNLALTAKRLDRDGSVSFFLDGVQVVEKNSTAGGGSPFDVVEGGYSAASADTKPSFDDDEETNFGSSEEAEDDDLPF
jgi:hypothetical protein